MGKSVLFGRLLGAESWCGAPLWQSISLV